MADTGSCRYKGARGWGDDQGGGLFSERQTCHLPVSASQVQGQQAGTTALCLAGFLWVNESVLQLNGGDGQAAFGLFSNFVWSAMEPRASHLLSSTVSLKSSQEGAGPGAF